MSLIERLLRSRLPLAVVILEAVLLFILVGAILPYALGKMNITSFPLAAIPIMLVIIFISFYCRMMVSRGKK